ncbi:MAG: 30S ribosomal protein S6 [Phycisphaerales bacterium JB058]
MADQQRINAYEVMFLISQAEATDFAGVIEHIDNLFERAGAEVVAMQKWDERRLAYEIDKQKRGVYILAYIKAPAENMQAFERDCNISERIMRAMFIRADHLTDEEMKAFDRRTDLASEAKERAERAAEREQAGVGSSVSLGAPKAPEPEPKAEEAEESEEKPAEATAEASTDAE